MPFVPTIVSRKTAAIVCGALVADDVLEALQALRHRTRLLLAPAVRVRVADDADEAGLVRPAARVAGQRHRPHRRAVVRAVAGEDLVAAGVVAGELDRVLDRLGAAEREEDLVDVAGQDLGELRPRAGPRISVANAGWTYWSLVACSVIASMTRRSPWPMLTDISWLLKSRIRLPSGV